MSPLTPEQLRQLMPLAVKPELHSGHLECAMHARAIDTPQRRSAFLAQVAHESGSLRYSEEIADGSAYEARVDLGNGRPGDGKLYKGRGWLQITGRTNYARCGAALGVDLLTNPFLLKEPGAAAASAAWFWHSRGLNALADAEQFGQITLLINGGYHLLDRRIEHWLRMRKVLGL